jgi:hypothetical protein
MASTMIAKEAIVLHRTHHGMVCDGARRFAWWRHRDAAEERGESDINDCEAHHHCSPHARPSHLLR